MNKSAEEILTKHLKYSKDNRQDYVDVKDWVFKEHVLSAMREYASTKESPVCEVELAEKMYKAILSTTQQAGGLNDAAKLCAKIALELPQHTESTSDAIEFAEWVIKRYWEKNNLWFRVNEMDMHYSYTIEQLYKTFKSQP